MITVEAVGNDEWLVTVSGSTTTTHRVQVTPEDLTRFGPARSVEELLKASFRFLLEREPNTSILSSFALPVIPRYFPEFENELPRYLAHLVVLGVEGPQSLYTSKCEEHPELSTGMGSFTGRPQDHPTGATRAGWVFHTGGILESSCCR
jgi:hypothetical protein